MPRLAATEIAAELRKRIVAGQWSGSGRIPPERDLAEEFGVARNTMRRAMSLLIEDGMVVRQIGRGTFLTQADPSTLAGVVARMEGTSPADMMEIRQLLEPAAASFAATNASNSELNAVREAHQAACDAFDMPAFEHWDAQFHHRIFACSRNEFLKEVHNLLRVLRNQSPWLEMKKRSFSEERRLTYCREHEAIVEALMLRDPGTARDTMLDHLQTVGYNLLGR